MSPPAIEVARHVVLGDSGGGALLQAGARDVVVWTSPRWSERLALAFAAGPVGALEVVGDDPAELRRRLRITVRGAGILRHGLDRAAAPPMFAGGHELYGPRTWALRGGRIVPVPRLRR
jgi:hypothetical protein